MEVALVEVDAMDRETSMCEMEAHAVLERLHASPADAYLLEAALEYMEKAERAYERSHEARELLVGRAGVASGASQRLVSSTHREITAQVITMRLLCDYYVITM